MPWQVAALSHGAVEGGARDGGWHVHTPAGRGVAAEAAPGLGPCPWADLLTCLPSLSPGRLLC